MESIIDPMGGERRARSSRHAALGVVARLAIVDELAVSDRSPGELADLLGIPSNLLAHHLDVLEDVGLVRRSASSGDRRRKYVQLVRESTVGLGIVPGRPVGELLFLCTRNSARSQLASALWTARTGRRSSSAGTDPAPSVHRGAVAAARRAGIELAASAPRSIERIPDGAQVVTVCDRAHEELDATPSWWHWSIEDPVEDGSDDAFDHVVREIDGRIALLFGTSGRKDDR